MRHLARRLATNWRLLALIAMTPVLQVTCHAMAKSGFLASLGPGQRATATRIPLGILVNERDNMSYAAWAQQTKLGLLLCSDLYTTLYHKAVLFNPYFLMIGMLSRLTDLAPFSMMIAVSIAASGVFGVVIYKIARQVGLARVPAHAATFIALFCSGPSWMLFLLSAGLGQVSQTQRPFLGIDVYYFDIFPVTIFLAYLYASFNLVILSIAVFLINSALGDKSANRSCILSAAFACACAVLVRPYDALLLSVLFPACLLVSAMQTEARTIPRGRFLLNAALVCVVTWPACLYVMSVSKAPVWRDFANGSLGQALPGWKC